MANVSVTYEEMTRAAARLEAGEGDLDTKLTELQKFIGDLVTNGFVTDKASVSFNEAYNEFTSNIRDGIKALSSMATYLRTAASKLEETDQSLTVTYG